MVTDPNLPEKLVGSVGPNLRLCKIGSNTQPIEFELVEKFEAFIFESGIKN